MGNLVGKEPSELSGEIPQGLAFWYMSKQTEDVSWTHSGAVDLAKDFKRIDFPANDFCLRNNPFPKSFSVNDGSLDNSEIVPVDYDSDFEFCKTATQIQVPNGVTYDTFYYINGAYYTDDEGEHEVTGWADEMGNLVGKEPSELSGVIDTMQGFWVRGVNGAGAITFKLNK